MKDRIWKTAGEKDIEDLRAEFIEVVVKRHYFVDAMPKCWMLDKVANKAYEFVRTNKDGHQIVSELRDEIQLQLLSIVSLCYGDGPDCGEPCPMLEWSSDIKGEENAEDRFRRVWEECLEWNA